METNSSSNHWDLNILCIYISQWMKFCGLFSCVSLGKSSELKDRFFVRAGKEAFQTRADVILF